MRWDPRVFYTMDGEAWAMLSRDLVRQVDTYMRAHPPTLGEIALRAERAGWTEADDAAFAAAYAVWDRTDAIPI